MKEKSLFICLEGLDGCGKTTQTRLLVRQLKKRGYNVVGTAEPSKGKIGQFVKKYYLHGQKRGSSVVEALLFAADRIEHVNRAVLPALENGRHVVSDRYVYSSLAYQGATGLDLDWIKSLNKHAMSPDLALFIDVEPTTVVKRLKAKRSVMENLQTQRKVREVYMKFVNSGDLLKVDGNKPEREVADEIFCIVLNLLENPSLRSLNRL